EFKVEHASEYLYSLDNKSFEIAKLYIDEAPQQISTLLRRAIHKDFQWPVTSNIESVLSETTPMSPELEPHEQTTQGCSTVPAYGIPTTQQQTAQRGVGQRMHIQHLQQQTAQRGYLEDVLVGMIATAVTAPGIAIVVTLILYMGLWPDNGALAL